MKKVIILNHNYAHGSYYACKQWADTFSSNKIYTHLFSASAKNFDLNFTTVKDNIFFKETNLPKIKIFKFFSGHLLRLFCNLYIVLFFKYDYLIITAHSQFQNSLPAILAKLLFNKKYIILNDDIWHDGFGKEHGWFINKVFYLSEYLSNKRCHKMIFHNKLYRNFYKKKFNLKNKTSVIEYYNQNNPQKFKLSLKDRKKIRSKIFKSNSKDLILLSVGNTYTNSIKLLTKTVELLNRSETKYKLFFAGSAKFSKEILDMNSIFFLGHIPKKKIIKICNAADVLVLPIDNNFVDKYRFPIRLIDYITSSTPIVTTSKKTSTSFLFKKHKIGYISNYSLKSLRSQILQASKKNLNTKKKVNNANGLAISLLNLKKNSNKVLGIISD